MILWALWPTGKGDPRDKTPDLGGRWDEPYPKTWPVPEGFQGDLCDFSYKTKQKGLPSKCTWQSHGWSYPPSCPRCPRVVDIPQLRTKTLWWELIDMWWTETIRGGYSTVVWQRTCDRNLVEVRAFQFIRFQAIPTKHNETLPWEKTNLDFSCFWLDLIHRQNGHKVAVLVARVSEEDLAYKFKNHENEHICEILYMHIVGAVEGGEDVPVCGWGLWLCHLHMTM